MEPQLTEQEFRDLGYLDISSFFVKKCNTEYFVTLGIITIPNIYRRNEVQYLAPKEVIDHIHNIQKCLYRDYKQERHKRRIRWSMKIYPRLQRKAWVILANQLNQCKQINLSFLEYIKRLDGINLLNDIEL